MNWMFFTEKQIVKPTLLLYNSIKRQEKFTRKVIVK